MTASCRARNRHPTALATTPASASGRNLIAGPRGVVSRRGCPRVRRPSNDPLAVRFGEGEGSGAGRHSVRGVTLMHVTTGVVETLSYVRAGPGILSGGVSNAVPWWGVKSARCASVQVSSRIRTRNRRRQPSGSFIPFGLPLGHQDCLDGSRRALREPLRSPIGRRPSRASTSARPDGRIRPAAINSSTLAPLICDQRLRGRRRTCICEVDVVERLRPPEIQP